MCARRAMDGRQTAEALARLLGYSVHSGDQDWTYTLAEPDRIGEYIDVYQRHSLDDDMKRLFMEMIIQAANDQQSPSEMQRWWLEVKNILASDLALHVETMEYWCCFRASQEDCFEISPFVRAYWKELFSV